MTRYLGNTPSKDELHSVVSELFARASEDASAYVLSALVPVDKTMEEGYRVLNWAVDFEMQELCDLVSYFSWLVDQEEDTARRGRMQLLVYCHVFEADFPLTTLWNLHRLLLGDLCSWTFHRLTRNGNLHVCKYPRERVQELARLSREAGTALGDVIQRLWRAELRNSFSHSQYFWAGNTLTCTGRLSPISRTGTGVGEAGSKSFTHEDINDLYHGALGLLAQFVKSYKRTVKTYQDGHVHAIQDGWITWDETRKRWMWAETADT